MSDFEWSELSEEAAKDLSLGELSDEAIAEKAGVSRRTLATWKLHPEFATRVAEILDAFRARIRRRGIAILERRVDALDDRWRRMQRVIEERGADPKMVDVPGGATGLIVHNVKGVGKGDDFRLIDLYEVDTGLLKELREHEKQAAQELGQWVEKQETKAETTHHFDERFKAALARSYGKPGDYANDPGGLSADVARDPEST